jgi:hypothetical protein
VCGGWVDLPSGRPWCQTASVAANALSRAHDLHRQARWEEACAVFLTADTEVELGVEDVELLAEAAEMSGRQADAIAALERAFRMRAAAGELDAAASAAFWLFTAFLYAGDIARAGGWVARLHDLTEELDARREPGWLLITGAYRCIGEGGTPPRGCCYRMRSRRAGSSVMSTLSRSGSCSLVAHCSWRGGSPKDWVGSTRRCCVSRRPRRDRG